MWSSLIAKLAQIIIIGYLPTIRSSTSLADFLILRQMSIVNSVELELKMDVSELMRALSMTANIIPRAPENIIIK